MSMSHTCAGGIAKERGSSGGVRTEEGGGGEGGGEGVWGGGGGGGVHKDFSQTWLARNLSIMESGSCDINEGIWM